MTILEASPRSGEILEFVDQSIAALAESDAAVGFIMVGPDAYEALCQEIAVRNVRGRGVFETYNHIPIAVDPFRGDRVCVLPKPAAALDAKGYSVPTE